jgi:NADH-quinone oxidoreductase subunit B
VADHSIPTACSRASIRLCPPRPENLFYALLKLQDKIDQMTTLAKRPTEVRLDEGMLENFKQQVRIAQVNNPA